PAAMAFTGLADGGLGNVDAEIAGSAVVDELCGEEARPAPELDHALARQKRFEQFRRDGDAIAQRCARAVGNPLEGPERALRLAVAPLLPSQELVFPKLLWIDGHSHSRQFLDRPSDSEP